MIVSSSFIVVSRANIFHRGAIRQNDRRRRIRRRKISKHPDDWSGALVVLGSQLEERVEQGNALSFFQVLPYFWFHHGLLPNDRLPTNDPNKNAKHRMPLPK